jgi:thioredoxin-like negative regulator of GroEL
MNMPREDTEKWSIERLKFEIDVLRQNKKSLENELQKLENELNRDPRDPDIRYSSGVRYIRHKIGRIKDQVEKLKEYMRNKI